MSLVPACCTNVSECLQKEHANCIRHLSKQGVQFSEMCEDFNMTPLGWFCDRTMTA